jgi:hypothetical protein
MRYESEWKLVDVGSYDRAFRMPKSAAGKTADIEVKSAWSLKLLFELPTYKW